VNKHVHVTSNHIKSWYCLQSFDTAGWHQQIQQCLLCEEILFSSLKRLLGNKHKTSRDETLKDIKKYPMTIVTPIFQHPGAICHLSQTTNSQQACIQQLCGPNKSHTTKPHVTCRNDSARQVSWPVHARSAVVTAVLSGDDVARGSGFARNNDT